MTDPSGGPRGWSYGRTGPVTFLLTGILVAVVNAAFQRVASAGAGVDDVGALNALVAVVAGIGLLGLGLQVVLARAGTLRIAIGRAAAVAGVLGAGGAAALVPGPWWYRAGLGAALGVAVVGALGGVPHRARLLADASWRRLAASYLVGAVVRLGTAAPIAWLVDNRVVAALWATALGEVATSSAAYVLARPQYRGAWRGSPQRIDRATARLLARSTAALGGLWALTVADTVLARRVLPAGDADSYAFGSTVARSSFFLAVLLAHLALPTFMSERARSRSLRRAFGVTIAIIGSGALAVTAVVLAAPRWAASTVLGGEAAAVDVTTLRLLALAWAATSMLPLLTYFHLERHPRVAFAPLAGGVALVALGSLVETQRGLAAVLLCVHAAVAAVMGVPASQRLAPVTRSAQWRASALPAHVRERDVTIVMPFYNPGPAAVVDTVRRLHASLDTAGVRHRIVAVSDGSTDGSAGALAAAGLDHVDVVELPVNRGKGAALRAGLERSGGSMVGYLDADGDLPPEQVLDLLAIASATGADAVIGSKTHPGSHLEVEGYRRAMSKLFRATVRVLFRLDVRDTQTGLKLYRGDLLADVAPLLREDGFAIDVEILVAAMRARSRSISIVEAPVRLRRGATTTVSLRRAATTAFGLVRIFWRDHVALAYEPIAVGVTPSTAA